MLIGSSPSKRQTFIEKHSTNQRHVERTTNLPRCNIAVLPWKNRISGIVFSVLSFRYPARLLCATVRLTAPNTMWHLLAGCPAQQIHSSQVIENMKTLLSLPSQPPPVSLAVQQSLVEPRPILLVADRSSLKHLRSPLQSDAVADEVVLEDPIVTGLIACVAMEEVGWSGQT